MYPPLFIKTLLIRVSEQVEQQRQQQQQNEVGEVAEEE
jgi:hypothetical protein